ncbi:hypothetical protein M3G15_20795 [Paenibacillus sp. p3-SID1389]|nr:hypothetical protein [Paenibacillus sp. p3-SID1389]
MTYLLMQAGEVIGIKLLGHLILGAENRLLP